MNVNSLGFGKAYYMDSTNSKFWIALSNGEPSIMEKGKDVQQEYESAQHKVAMTVSNTNQNYIQIFPDSRKSTRHSLLSGKVKLVLTDKEAIDYNQAPNPDTQISTLNNIFKTRYEFPSPLNIDRRNIDKKWFNKY